MYVYFEVCAFGLTHARCSQKTLLLFDAVIPSLAASQHLCVISDVLRLSNGHQIVVVPRLLESIGRVLRERER